MEKKIDLIARLLLINNKIKRHDSRCLQHFHDRLNNERVGASIPNLFDEREYELQKITVKLLSERFSIEEELEALLNS